MRSKNYFHNCSEEYVDYIHSDLFNEINNIIERLTKKQTQTEINKELFWLFIDKGWSFDSLPAGLSETPDIELDKQLNKHKVRENNKRSLCLTSSTLEAGWLCDYAKLFSAGLVQIEVQFGKVESMFKDFCGFKIAHSEKRLSLGVEIIMDNPQKYFSHRKSSVSGMAYFDIAKNTLPAIGLECPIWLIGIKE